MPTRPLTAEESAPADSPQGGGLNPWLALVAFVTWATLSFGHGYGLELAGELFAWAKEPGSLHPEGGVAGMRVLETYMAVVFGGLALIVFGLVGMLGFVRLRGAHLERLPGELARWALWAALVFLIWKCFIVYATELVHFVQYALVGFLVCAAIDKGRRPQLAFMITFASGFVDEIWQHYGLHVWLMGDLSHWMDWSDPVLDGLGAAGGILPFVSLQRLTAPSDEEIPSQFGVVVVGTLIAAALFLPLLLLGPEETARFLGSYRLYPFWGEYDNHKPTHWPNPAEGIPLILASLLLIGIVLEPRPRALGHGGLLVLALLMIGAIQPYSRQGGMPVHEVVPQVEVPFTTTPPTIDGKLDDPAWEQAVRLGPFVNTVDGQDVLTLSKDGPAGPVTEPLKETHARVLWDDQALYIAFEVKDPDVWAREGLQRDEPTLPGDEVVEVFLDDGGDEVTYYEFEVSPANVVYDLFNWIPAAPQDYDPDNKFIGLKQWDARGLETAVDVQGQLDLTPNWAEKVAPEDVDQGWTCEIKIPWENFRTTTTPSGSTIRPLVRPQNGERWRLGLYRVDRPRIVSKGEGEPELTREEVKARLHVDDREIDQQIRNGNLKPVEAGGVERFSPFEVRQRVAAAQAQYQAWSPTHNIRFHIPPRFGAITFAGRPE